MQKQNMRLMRQILQYLPFVSTVVISTGSSNCPFSMRNSCSSIFEDRLETREPFLALKTLLDHGYHIEKTSWNIQTMSHILLVSELTLTCLLQTFVAIHCQWSPVQYERQQRQQLLSYPRLFLLLHNVNSNHLSHLLLVFLHIHLDIGWCNIQGE